MSPDERPVDPDEVLDDATFALCEAVVLFDERFLHVENVLEVGDAGAIQGLDQFDRLLRRDD